MLQGRRHVAKLEQEEDEKQVVAVTRRSPAEEVKDAEVEGRLTRSTEDTEAVTMKNFHGEQCRTCVRMRTIMGDILPHPVNV